MYCPYFNIGTCNIANCSFKYHVKCSKNYLCQSMDCPYGHNVSPKKRLIIQDIIKKKNCLDIHKQCCKSPITCYEPNCLLSHYVDYEHRMIINAIIKTKGDTQAEAIYFKQFVTKSSNIPKEPLYQESLNGCDINLSDLDNYMIVPKSTKLQDIIKNNINTEIVKNKLITELQKQQQELITTTKKLNKTIFHINQSLFEKQENTTQLDKLQQQYRYLISITHQR